MVVGGILAGGSSMFEALVAPPLNSDADGTKTIKFFRDVKRHDMLHKWDRCRNRDSYLAEADGPSPR